MIYGLIGFVLLWVAFTSVHSVGLRERGVVTTFGRFERIIEPGIGFTWPVPFSRVDTVSFDEIRELTI
ncbi:MAG: SPFH domain-containing protein, partial [Gammaproteobacteria bacterium]